MMDDEQTESEIVLVGLLLDALGYCGEDSYDIILQIADTKLKALAKSGHPKFAYLQAHMPQFGMDAEEQELRFNSLIKQSSDAGVPQAQYEHACRLWEQDEHLAAVALYKASADKGFPPSQYCYGLGLFNGVGILKNETTGLYFIELAASRLYNLALEFLKGHYGNDLSVQGRKKFKLYSNMLIWSQKQS